MWNSAFNPFFDIIENLQDGLWVTDASHRIIYANPAMASIAGVELDEIMGSNVLEDFPKQTLKYFRKQYQQAFASGRPKKYECKVVTPAGRATWQGGWLSPKQKYGRFAGMVCTVQDITKRKRAAISLQASEKRFRNLLDAIPFVAVQGYAPDGTTHYWNQASEQLYGYSAEEAIGSKLIDLIIPAEMQQEVQASMQQMFLTKQPIPPGELSLTRKDGSRVEVFSSHAIVKVPGQAREMFCVDIDLTDRKRMEQTLRQREQYQRALLDNFPFMVWLKDNQSRFLAVNQNFAKHFGCPSSESLIGKTDLDISPVGLAQRYQADDLAVLASGMSRQQEELIEGRGEQRWFETYKSPITVDGSVIGTVGFSRDITEDKHSKVALITAIAEAEKANNAKSRFLAAASHDLRQPLAALSLYVGLLKNKVSPDSGELVDCIQNCVDSLSDLLTDLLDTSKLDAGVVTPQVSDFAAGELLTTLVSVHAAEAELKGLRLRCRPSNLIVRTDQTLLRRILGNLLENAIRYTDHGGVLIACRHHQGKHWVEVWDTGIGIPPDETEVIFEEFRQLGDNSRNRGSGLGLAIVSKTIKLLGLNIRLRSRPGHGSMFAIELPPGGVIEPQAPPLFRPVTRPLRVGLVDDNTSVLQALSLALENIGHEVFAATTGHELIKQLGDLRPDIVVSDYRLAAAENGFDVIENTRKYFGSDLPALLITGDTDPVLIRSMADRGIAVHYKPLQIETLQAFIRQATEQRPL